MLTFGNKDEGRDAVRCLGSSSGVPRPPAAWKVRRPAVAGLRLSPLGRLLVAQEMVTVTFRLPLPGPGGRYVTSGPL